MCAAYDAGYLVAVLYQGCIYVLSNKQSSYCYFGAVASATSKYLVVQGTASWSAGTKNLETTNDKTSDIESNKTSTTKYATTKGVADYIASKELSDLADVSDTAPTDGQALLWDGTNAEWKPGTVQGGGTVTDVTVGGTSVVNQQGVAEVPEIPEAVTAQEIGIDSTPTENSQNLVTSGGIYAAIQAGSGTPEVFWAEYGVTTAAEIDAGLANGKMVLLNGFHNNGRIAVCV